MKSSAHIINELKEISPLLASIEKRNVFLVPEDYFTNLNRQIRERINEDYLIPAVSGNTLQAPEGYFQNLAGNVLKRIKSIELESSENELKELSPTLYTVKNKNVYKVPNTYFENLSGNILNRIKSIELESFDNELKVLSPLLYAAQNKNAFKVPEGYFENLTGNILESIKSIKLESFDNELKELSPMLHAVENKNVFKVPEGYFENLTSNVLINAKSQQQAKVVAMKKRSYFWNYAAAAIITGMIALSSLWILNKPSKQTLDGHITETAFIPSSSIKESFKYKNEQQIEEGISTLSEDDIIKYLETTDSDINNEDLAALIGDKELPAEEDYLVDDKTLEKYLDQIDLNTSEN